MQAIDAVISGLDVLVKEVMDLSWHVLAKEHAVEWKLVITHFNASLAAAQKAAQEVVDSSFR